MKVENIDNNLDVDISDYRFGTFTAILISNDKSKEISIPYEILITNISKKDPVLGKYIKGISNMDPCDIMNDLVEIGVDIDEKFRIFALSHYTEHLFTSLPVLY